MAKVPPPSGQNEVWVGSAQAVQPESYNLRRTEKFCVGKE